MVTNLHRNQSDYSDVISDLIDRFLTRIQHGEKIEPEEFANQHAEHARELLDYLPAVQAIAEFGVDESGAIEQSELHVENEPIQLNGVLGDFRIKREIGRGGMGVVYEAEQITLGRPVALKLLPLAATLDSRQLARFKNEARAAATLHHPNIVPIYSVGSERGVHYYAMQLIEGRSFAELLREMKTQNSPAHVPLESNTGSDSGASNNPSHVTPNVSTCALAAADVSTSPVSKPRKNRRDSRHIDITATDNRRTYFRSIAQRVIQIAQALEYAHSQGVVHRDIKPANLMLDHDGNSWIADFGLARLDSDVGVTMTGDMIGTLRYMAPETLLSKNVVADPRIDIYSLGVTFYELLSLQPAFDSENRHELTNQVAHSEPKLLREIDRSIPFDLETIVLKAIEENPTDRYRTAAELADDVQRFLNDQPVSARRPALTERVMKWCRRHRSFAFSAIMIMVFLTIGLSIATLLVGQSLRQEQVERQQAEKNLAIAREAVDNMAKRAMEEFGKSKAPEWRNQLADAVGFYQRILQQDSQNDETRFAAANAARRLAQIYFVLGESEDSKRTYSEAITKLQELYDRSPDDPRFLDALAETHLGFGYAYRDLGEHESARREIKEAYLLSKRLMNQFPNRLDFQARFARNAKTHAARIKQSDPREAKRIYGEVLNVVDSLSKRAKEIQDVKVLGLLASGEYGVAGFLMDQSQPSKKRRARDLMRSSIKHTLTAIELSDRRKTYDESLMVRYGRLAETLLRTGERAEERQAWNKAEAIALRLESMASTSILRSSASFHRREGDPKKAEVNYRKSIEIAGRFLSKTTGNYIEPRRNYCNCMMDLGELLIEQGNVDVGIDHIKKANQALRAFVNTRRRGQHDNLRRCDELLIRSLIDAGQTDGAEKVQHESLEYWQQRVNDSDLVKDHELRNILAWHFANHENAVIRSPGIAIRWAKQAVEMAPENGGYLNTLGVAYYRFGDSQLALNTLQKSLARKGTWNEIDRFVLAMAFWRLGDKESARRYLDHANRTKNYAHDSANSWKNEANDLIDNASE